MENSWDNLLNRGIKYKKQNYVGSCVAAAYQNLAANLYCRYEHIEYASRYCRVELSEYDFMKAKGCDLKKKAPPKTLVCDFINMNLDQFHFSTSLILPEITISDLVEFGEKGVSKCGYLLWQGYENSLHAVALFIKQIDGQPYYILLNSVYDYNNPKDWPYLAQPCSDKSKALDLLGLDDHSIHAGGMLTTFY